MNTASCAIIDETNTIESDLIIATKKEKNILINDMQEKILSCMSCENFNDCGRVDLLKTLSANNGVIHYSE